ncbi:MAG: Trans-aconitate 2-methyltransferase [Candidatus Heimdallarchaeota archaeon LC_2]|nr:MAG: Trans-aconitate 2-methyltransferase [Candidatus Heimdallarchaeota archaeon LC_2]
MSEINITKNKLQRYLLKFDGVTCPGCVTAVKKTTSQLDETKFVEISESSGDTIITSSLWANQIKFELNEFEGCCSDCQIAIREVEETDLDTFETLFEKPDDLELVKKQYKIALERALEGIEVACSDNCVCKTTDVDRLSESDGVASFASVYNLNERINSFLEQGMLITDFGCGTGHDAILTAEIVNPGIVTGIDVTPEMVKFATEQAKLQGINNVKFIESFDLSPLEKESQDVIYVNNVLNLLNDKSVFLLGAYEKLKLHGLLIIADEFALEEFPTELRDDESFQCGGISGAEFVENVETMAIEHGFKISHWESIKEYDIEFNNEKYKLKTGILILQKSIGRSGIYQMN